TFSRSRELHYYPTRRSSDLNPENITIDPIIRTDINCVQTSPELITITPVEEERRVCTTVQPESIGVAKVTRVETSCMTTKPELRSEEHTSELQSRENLVCRL